MAGVPLGELVSYLDEYLRIREVPDERNAVNGLQVENSGIISRIVAAVDASQATIDGLSAGPAGALLLAAGGPLWVSGLGAAALGLAAGLPFAAIFDATQRARPDAPAAAVALVNGCAVLTILVGTPIAGLAFDLPGEGAVAFAVIGALVALSLLALPRARL